MNSGTVRFDRLARLYRTLEMAAFGKDLERARFCFLPRMAASRDILLLGEGDGRCSARLAALAPAARLKIVDSSPAMIELTRRRLAGLAALERVHFVCADVFSQEFRPASFDAVATLFFLDCFPAAQVETLVARIGPALRPGAIWLYADFSLPDRGWARARGHAWLALLYAFFRWQTRLQANRLPPSESILARAGWHERDAREYQAGLVRSAVLTR